MTYKTITAGELKVGDVLDTGEKVTLVISEPTEDGWIVSLQTADESYFHYESDEVEIIVGDHSIRCSSCQANREWIDGIATAYGIKDHFCCVPLFKTIDR